MKRIMYLIGLLVLFALSLLMFVPAASIAQGVPGPGEPASLPEGPALTALPLGIIVVSFVMTGLGYALNYALPFLKTDRAKGLAHGFYQLLGVTGYELATGSDFGFNEQTGGAFVVAILTWGLSHGLLFKPTDWAVNLGAGRNAGDGSSS